jgi:hypothetical protein
VLSARVRLSPMVRRESINVSWEEEDLEIDFTGILDSGMREEFVVVMVGRDRRERGGGGGTSSICAN